MPVDDDSTDDSPAARLSLMHFRSWERELRARNRSDLTVRTYWQAYEHLIARYPDRDTAELTTDDLRGHIAASLTELKATTVAIRFRGLRAFYNWAVAEEIIDRSPMAKMTEPNVTDVPPDVLDDDELRKLLKACEGKTFMDRRDTAIIRLFCEPGSPRAAEMAAIRVDEDLDMGRDLVRVRGKGDRVRFIPFGAKTGQALDRYLRMRSKHPHAKSPMLWLGNRSGPMVAGGIGQMLSRRSKQAGIGHKYPHQLRHTAAHAWADSGGSEGDAMELFGWKSPDMPRRYGRVARTTRAHRAARRASLGDRL